MEDFTLTPIGRVKNDEKGMRIVLDKIFAPALIGLEGFSHIQILWWFSECDNTADRHSLTHDSPYKKSPDVLGTFATRSPMRPNPIALSCAQIIYIDPEAAEIGLAFIEAFDGTPVLDIKPYTPSIDRVENPQVPLWCRHWPRSYDESGDFDWENEMND